MAKKPSESFRIPIPPETATAIEATRALMADAAKTIKDSTAPLRAAGENALLLAQQRMAAALKSTSDASGDEYERLTVDRDDAPALEFDGVILAAIEEDLRGAPAVHDSPIRLRAAVYRTKGGKFIAEFSRYQRWGVLWDAKANPPKLFDKAGVFDSLDSAVAFFRPGRLTNALLAELGVKQTEFIE